MARDDEYDDELPEDNMAGLANGMIILTTVVLIVAWYLVADISAAKYGVGLLS